jgi:hypothetical protein
MIAETYLLEILVPGSEKWLDCGMRSKFHDFTEAQKELERTIRSYPPRYKFRINHISCEEEVVLEVSGKQDILNS